MDCQEQLLKWLLIKHVACMQDSYQTPPLTSPTQYDIVKNCILCFQLNYMIQDVIVVCGALSTMVQCSTVQLREVCFQKDALV